jgi:putative ABC transport system permease protein
MTLLQDLTHAGRALAKNPGFATVAILTLALGIGANTAIFSIINGVLLSPLPYPDPDRIVAVSTFFKQTGATTPRLTGGDLVDIRADGEIFDALSYYIGGEMGVQLPGRAEFTGAYLVNPDFFRVFGVRPAYGRLFENDDQDRAAVINLAFAERNFGTGPAALGRAVRIENRAYEIVGVLPAGFQFPAEAQVWAPAPVTPDNLNRTAYNYRTVARLKSGVTLETAEAHLETIGARLASSLPDSNRNKSFVAIPLRDQLVGPVRTTLYLLMGAVALVLLIACTNVADLMLARATARSREIAVRAALGARRWHIVRPLLVESAVLALAGGALGLLLANVGTDLLVRVSSDRVPLPRLNDIHVDRLVLIFATAVSLASSLIFGLIPAWQATRVDLQDALKQGGARGLLGGRSPQLRNGLVVAQIALSFVLAVGAGLLMRSFVALNNAQLGFRTDGVLVMYAHAPAGTLDEQLGVGRLFERLFGELAGLPGVKSVAGAMGLPTGQYGSNGYYAVEGKHIFAPGQRLPHAGFRLASPGYFVTMGIPLLAGREFSSRDRHNSNFVAIISEALARETFPNEDPLGKRVQCGLDSPNWMTIVGVVGDVRQDSPASAPGPELYMPLQQHPYHANELQVVVRTAVEPGSLINAVRQKVRALNPEIAMKFTTLDAMVADSIARPRFRMLLISAFAGLALLLVMAGVYGVMSYVTTQRTSEFGLRSALGAAPRDLVALVLKSAIRLATVGLALGILLSLAAGRAMASMLFGLKPADALTYVAVLCAVTPMVLLATAVPAWRAARIDPLTALREE